MLKNVTLIGNIWHVIRGAQDRCRIYPGRCAFFGSELRTVFFVAKQTAFRGSMSGLETYLVLCLRFWGTMPGQSTASFQVSSSPARVAGRQIPVTFSPRSRSWWFEFQKKVFAIFWTKSTEPFQRNFVRNWWNIVSSWIILLTSRIENRSVI